MCRAKGIVVTFIALGETRQAARHAQRPNAVAAAGENFMRISLVTNVPDQAIVRRVEHPMQRDGQFNDAETGAQMPARHRDRINRLLPKFSRQLRQFRFAETAKV